MGQVAPTIDPGIDSWLDTWCNDWWYNDHGFDPGPSTADICTLVIYSTTGTDPGTSTMTRDEYDALADPAYDSLGDFMAECPGRPVYGDWTDTCEEVIAWAAITDPDPDPDPDPPGPGSPYVSVEVVAALAVALVTATVVAFVVGASLRR